MRVGGARFGFAGLVAMSFGILTASASPPANQSPSVIGKNSITEPSAGRPWSPADSVAVRYFDTDTTKVSPDGEKFFVVMFHGDLSCDCNVYEMAVYSARDILHSLAQQSELPQEPVKPLQTVIRRSSDHSGLEFFGVRWEADSKSISFESQGEAGVRQIYSLDVRSGAVTALTDWPHGVLYATHRGDTVISEVPVDSAAPAPPRYPVDVITRKNIVRALFHGFSETRTYVSYRGQAPWELSKTHEDIYSSTVWFSRDTRRVIAVRWQDDVPAGWEKYDGLPVHADTGHVEDIDTSRFFVIDAEEKLERPTFDSPIGTATKVGKEHARVSPPQALWAADDRHVVLINTALPVVAGETEISADMAYIAGYDVDSSKWSVIEPLEAADAHGTMRRVTRVGWLKEGVELLVGHEIAGKAVPATVYTLVGDRWQGRSISEKVSLPASTAPTSVDLVGGLKVTLRQSSNEPPVMVAFNGHREMVLTPPDPALREVRLTKEEPFRWRESDGRMMTGGLLLPEGGEAHGVPLVIQGYRYERDKFKPDGPTTNTYAAQSLAARGMVVLNVSIPALEPSIANTPKELTDYAELVRSAVDALAGNGTIDRKRVGLVGFSRAGYEVYYAITHPGDSPPAAAVIDDSFPGTYSYYLTQQALGGRREEVENIYRGSFWKDKASWLQYEPSFNVDKVVTPALFTVHNQQQMLYAVETIGAFSLNGRPVEYLVYPKGKHGLEMPRERLASIEATVDWMAFWLQGYEDPSPEKADQYARWHILRRQQEAERTQASQTVQH